MVNYPLVLREPWSLLCVDLFYSQFHFGASVPDSTLHFCALWRLHKSWLLASLQYPHLRKFFANYQVPQRVWNFWRTRTKNETPAGSRQSPARARRVSRVGPTAQSFPTPFPSLGRRLSLLWLRRASCVSSSWPREQSFHTSGFLRWRCH